MKTSIFFLTVASFFSASTVPLADAQAAEIIEAKLIDRDGDGLPDEDRTPSFLPQAAAIMYLSGNRNGSGVVVGRRHVLTVAHAFSSAGEFKGTTGDPRDGFYVHVEGCGNEVFGIREWHLGTLAPDTLTEQYKDYALLELDRNVCEHVDPLLFGGLGPERLESETLAVTGYYESETSSELGEIDYSVATRICRLNDIRSTFYSCLENDWRQYSSLGPVNSVVNLRGQEILLYEAGQTYGGSGGPVTAFVGGRNVLVGIQFIEPKSRNWNFAIFASGPFFDFVATHVPDLTVYEQ